jgi:hypothetical protein
LTKSWLLSLALVLPAAAHASVVWRGDFETGNTSQWTKEERVNSNRLVVETDRVHQGTYALRAEVDQGDKPIQASGNRNELVYVGEEVNPAAAEGKELYYSWSTLFNEDYPSANTWQVFTQWHHTGLNGSPPVEFYVLGEQMRMRVGGSTAQDLWSAPLNRGQWNDFVLHVKWSSDPNVGFVELYHNGQLVVPHTPRATMFRGDGVYMKQGLYRSDKIAPPGVVFHDGLTVATDLADVMPGAAPASVSAGNPTAVSAAALGASTGVSASSLAATAAPVANAVGASAANPAAASANAAASTATASANPAASPAAAQAPAVAPLDAEGQAAVAEMDAATSAPDTEGQAAGADTQGGGGSDAPAGSAQGAAPQFPSAQ